MTWTQLEPEHTTQPAPDAPTGWPEPDRAPYLGQVLTLEHYEALRDSAAQK